MAGGPAATPRILASAGFTYSTKETYEETGLPGNVKIGTRRSPSSPKPWGMPGCMATFSNRTVPSGDSASLTGSYAPIEMPPVVITASASPRRPCRVVKNSWGSSPTALLRNATPPACWTAATMVKLLDSQICPCPSGLPGSTSSAPVDSTTTRGRGWARTVRRPTPARMPSWGGPITVPAASTRSPARTSSPDLRMALPGGAGRLIDTLTVPPSVHSTGTTASAPPGTGAPVMMRVTVPRSTTRDAVSPAGTSTVTGSTTGASPVAPATSPACTA